MDIAGGWVMALGLAAWRETGRAGGAPWPNNEPDRPSWAALVRHLRDIGVTDERVLAAFAAVDRAAFVPEALRDVADEDRPLPIGGGQTISQPQVVAVMVEALELGPGDRVLDVAWLRLRRRHPGRLAGEVFTIERLADLAAEARQAAGGRAPPGGGARAGGRRHPRLAGSGTVRHSARVGRRALISTAAGGTALPRGPAGHAGGSRT
ncbi:MAG: hypothetical protein R2755_09440 [Acidimicrobiales bacterium]